MKNYITRALGVSAALMVLTTSCKKDEVKVNADFGATPTLTASTTAPIVLLQDNEDAPALSFSWKPYTIALSDGSKAVSSVTYTLQIAKSGTNFAPNKEISAGGNTASSLTIKTKDLNTALQSLKLPNGTPSQVDVRLRTSVVGNLDPVYSPVTTLTVTPYEYKAPAVCVQPAAAQAWTLIGPAGKDWSTDIAMTYDCATSTFTYTGPLNAGEFKFRFGGAWTANLGGDSSTGGALVQEGHNLAVATAGTYTIVLTPGEIGADGKATGGSFTIK